MGLLCSRRWDCHYFCYPHPSGEAVCPHWTREGHGDRKRRGSANGCPRSVAEQGTKRLPGNATQPMCGWAHVFGRIGSPCRPQLPVLREPLSPRKTFNWGVKLLIKTDEREVMRNKDN